MRITTNFSAAFEATLDWIEVRLAAAARRRTRRLSRERFAASAARVGIASPLHTTDLPESPETI